MKTKLLSNIIFILVLGLILSIIYIKIFYKDANIAPFGIQILQVQSDSMYPQFKKKDIIIIKKKKEYKIGEIITYKSEDGSLITHRIIEKTENGFITKGDNNNTKDEKEISEQSIIGSLLSIIHSSKFYLENV